MEIKTHPVQTAGHYYGKQPGQISQAVTMKAYEVYCELYGPQTALVEGSCRGGFSTGELIGFLYAHSFPRSEWRQRVDEAFKGMKNL
ncbi:conserved hypothetical protein [Gammaproteobacteria bacterium]